jgi:7-carboxy-7-deazaguanine synthase
MHYAENWRNTDEIKCVVANREDFDWCIQKLHQYKAFTRVIIHFPPVWDELAPAELVTWICVSQLPIRLNLQIHKVIWDPDARGV